MPPTKSVRKGSKIHIVLGSPQGKPRQRVLYAGTDILKARKAVVRFLRLHNIGPRRYWKKEEEFIAELREIGASKFVGKYSNLPGAFFISPGVATRRLDA